ncbi:uncharacterized protein LOC128730765 [Anopheles nili]|uniref:uncharacterized protein LOC128730765 n=1 Tax=Anopheles nili TaxID=185578 RepID=UPI00237BA157|nr:uncharacterized protein LOC128730765 [Anopheles nili]
MYSQSIVQVDWNERLGSIADIGSTGNGNVDVYRRFQDMDGGSNSSASNDTEYTTLLDESCRKNERLYDITPTERGERHNRGSTKNKIFLSIIAFCVLFTLLMGNFPYGNEHGRVGTIAGWGLNTSRQTIDYVFPYENTTLIDPTNVCFSEERAGLTEGSEKVFLLIVVCSSAANFEARQTIRQTWGDVREFNYDQFPRLHARLSGEYLDPKDDTVRRLKDYIWSPVADDEATERNDAQTRTNSSQSVRNDSTTARSSFNVKIVFLVGQSQSDYVHQQQRAAFPPEDTIVSVPSAPNGLSSGASPTIGAPAPDQPTTKTFRSSLFPNGGDVDPAFNIGVGADTVDDELQLRIVNESEVFGDIIQESFIDSYNNLTLKTVMMLKWVTNNCDGKVKFIMKCDDDTFVNVPNLLHVLLGGTVPLYKAALSFYDSNTVAVKSSKNRLVAGKHLLTGFLFCEAKPIVDTSSKWYSPTYMYNKNVYPNYLSGTAYLMNFEVAKALYRASLTTPIFHLEDVYLTGIVADRAKIRRRHHPLFFYSYTKDLCALRGMISQHQLQPSEIRTAFDYVTNSSVLCNGPEKNFTDGKLKLQQRKKCQ